MSKRKKQVCVVGLGHFGWELAVSLARECEVLAIDRNPELVNEIGDRVHRAVALDIHDEQALASVIPSDLDEAVVSMGESLESSVLCTLYLKRLNIPVVRVKTHTEDHAVVLRQLGADELIFPERETARRLAARIQNPNLLDFVPLGGDYQVVETKLPDTFRTRTLAELNVRARYDVFVLAVRNPDTNGSSPDGAQFLPGPDFRLRPGHVLLLVGRERNIVRFQESEAMTGRV
jgi:trk system potassium uptake protein TrkA